MSTGKITDHLANERTFLAWVRTSVALLGFGVVIAKLTFLMQYARRAALGASLPGAGHGGRTLLLGLLFCASGLVTLIFAAAHYLATRRTIDADEYMPPGAAVIAVTVVIAVLAVASIILLLQMDQ